MTKQETNIQAENEFPEISQMSYEAARTELAQVVKSLEGAETPLEDTMQLWERGEALAARCQSILDQAQAKVQAIQV